MLRCHCDCVLILFVLLAGVLLGWRVALAVAFSTAAVGVLFLWMASLGRLPDSSLPDNDFRVWLFHTVTIVLVVVLLRVGLGSIREALARAQYELQKRQLSEDRFAKIFRSSPNILILSELESGTILDVNESRGKFFGYHREEVLGKTAVELNIYPLAENRQSWVSDLRKNGFVRDTEIQLRYKDGKLHTCLLSRAAPFVSR